MQQTLNESLVKITRGTGVAFVGSLVGLFLAFIGRVLVARYGTEADYGIFSLAYVLLNICAVIAALGLQQGATRSIAYARGENDAEKVRKLIPAAVQFGLAAGIVLGVIVFFTADVVAARVFHDAGLAAPLKICALGIPFFTLVYVFAAIFRGFDDVKPMVYLQNVLRNLLFLVFLLPLIFLHLSFTGVFYAFLASLVICCVVLVIYAVKRLPSPVEFPLRLSIEPVARELLFFSLPLLGVAMLSLIVAWTDTLMLGGFRTSAEVGLYSAALPLAQFISMLIGAMALIYLPVASGLYARGAMAEIRKNLSILTKWLCSATLPIFFILFLFPETVLGFLFGAGYTPAAMALRILSLGLIIHNLLGLSSVTLIAMGEARFMMRATLAGAVLNIGLNLALIPPFGIEGAAIASIASITSVDLICCGKLYSLGRAQPLSRNLLKPTLASLALVFLFQFIFGNFVTVTWWMLPLLFVLYYVIYGLAVLLTRSFDKEDIAMLLALEKKLGVNLTAIKKILGRFV